MSVERLNHSLRLNRGAKPHSGARGRPFEKGNGGRKPGSRNRTTQIAEALLKGEEDALVRKGIELAKAGDVTMLKFLLDRILPKERSVHVNLPPMDNASNAVAALGAIIEAVSTGGIAPNEGYDLVNLVAAYARTMNVATVELRLDEIEKRQKEIQDLLEKLQDR